MLVKKRGAKIILFLVFGILAISFASAGLVEWYERLTGKATQGTTGLNITVSNNPPTIPFVFHNPTYNPVEINKNPIVINFTVRDGDGSGNIDTSTAQLRFQQAGEPTRLNTSCTPIGSAGTDMNFSCTIDQWYFDGSGAWIINATIRDLSGTGGENSTETFTYNLLTAMVMSPSNLTWPTVGPSMVDVGSSNDPILVNNTGNDIDLSLNVTGFDLQGESDPTKYIYANNFTVENLSQGCTGDVMSNATSLNITSAILQKGNNSLSLNNELSGQEELFFCLKGILATTTSQSYSSAAYGPWVVTLT